MITAWSAAGSMWRTSALLAVLACAALQGALCDCTPQAYPRTGDLPQVRAGSASRACVGAVARDHRCRAAAAPSRGAEAELTGSRPAPQAVNFSTTVRELQWLGFDKDADQVKLLLPVAGPAGGAALMTREHTQGISRTADQLTSSPVSVQYVFALPEAGYGVMGSELWRSDGYGAANSWKNMTDALPGKPPREERCCTDIRPCVTAAGVALASVRAPCVWCALDSEGGAGPCRRIHRRCGSPSTAQRWAGCPQAPHGVLQQWWLRSFAATLPSTSGRARSSHSTLQQRRASCLHGRACAQRWAASRPRQCFSLSAAAH